MATHTFDNMSQLMSYFETDLLKLMNTELKEDVKDVFHKHIMTDVYGAYEPGEYMRRGALGARTNLVGFVKNTPRTKVLYVENIAPGNYPLATGSRPHGTQLMEIVDKGLQGTWVWPGAFARPALRNTQKSDELKKAVLKRLKKRYREA